MGELFDESFSVCQSCAQAGKKDARERIHSNHHVHGRKKISEFFRAPTSHKSQTMKSFQLQLFVSTVLVLLLKVSDATLGQGGGHVGHISTRRPKSQVKAGSGPNLGSTFRGAATQSSASLLPVHRRHPSLDPLGRLTHS
jgi:hypothetical protein